MSAITVIHLKRHDGAKATLCVADEGVPSLEAACTALGWDVRSVDVEKTHQVPAYVIDRVAAVPCEPIRLREMAP